MFHGNAGLVSFKRGLMETTQRVTRNFSGQGQGHFNKHLICNPQKKDPAGKNSVDFFPRYT